MLWGFSLVFWDYHFGQVPTGLKSPGGRPPKRLLKGQPVLLPAKAADAWGLRPARVFVLDFGALYPRSRA